MSNDYYYLHTNGDLIFKPADVTDIDPSYFDSDFVKKVWPVDLRWRSTAYSMLIEAQAMGAKIERIQELRRKWDITNEDTQIYADKEGFKLVRDDNQWSATLPSFKNLQEDPVGFGDTRWDAMVELCKKIKAIT